MDALQCITVFENRVAQLDQVATRYVEQAVVDRQTMVALIEMGDVVRLFGVEDASDAEGEDLPVERRSAVQLARKFYGRALEIASGIAANDSSSVEAQEDLSLAYERFGDVQLLLELA